MKSVVPSEGMTLNSFDAADEMLTDAFCSEVECYDSVLKRGSAEGFRLMMAPTIGGQPPSPRELASED